MNFFAFKLIDSGWKNDSYVLIGGALKNVIITKYVFTQSLLTNSELYTFLFYYSFLH